MKESILIITDSKDLQGNLVIEKLKLRKANYFRFNVDEYPVEINFKTEFTENGDLFAEIAVKGNIISSQKTKSVLYFPSALSRMDRYNLEEFKSQTIEDFVRLECDSLLNMSFVAFQESFWLIDPQKVKIGNKFQDLFLAKKIGFSTPNSFIANLPKEQRKFLLKEKEVVLKTMKGVLKKEGGRKISTFAPVRKIHEDELVAKIPMFLQSCVEKKYELRVTIVGEHIFPCVIDSQKSNNPKTRMDWRVYDFENVSYKKYKLPANIKEKCMIFMKQRGLNYSAIDMIVTPDNQYVFLESNTHGIWHWVEILTGMPISDTIADILINPPK